MKGTIIDEEWIYNCVEANKLQEAVGILNHDGGKKALVQLAEKRLNLLRVGPSESDKKKAEDLRVKGNDYVRKGDYKTAMGYYTESIKINPIEAGSFGNRALTYQKTNNIKRAIEDAKNTILLDKNFARGYQRLAEAYLLDRKYQKAYVAAKAMLKKDSGNKAENTLMANIKKGLLDNGISVHEANIDKEVAELMAGRFGHDEAEPMEDIKAPSNPSNTSEIERYFGPYNKLRQEAKELHKSGKFDMAIEVYKQAFDLIERMEKNPGGVSKEEFEKREALLYSNLAVCFKQKQEQSEVIAYSTKVIDSPAATSDMKLKAYILRAFAYEAVDRLSKAKADWIKVKEIQPGNFDASKALTRIAHALHEDDVQKKLDTIGESIRGLEEYKEKGNKFYKASTCF
jgi:tetratricopeptide (TPR) repeat protein